MTVLGACLTGFWVDGGVRGSGLRRAAKQAHDRLRQRQAGHVGAQQRGRHGPGGTGRVSRRDQGFAGVRLADRARIVLGRRQVGPAPGGRAWTDSVELRRRSGRRRRALLHRPCRNTAIASIPKGADNRLLLPAWADHRVRAPTRDSSIRAPE